MSTDSSFVTGGEQVGIGQEIAVAISISQATEIQTKNYIGAQLPDVGKLLSFNIPNGPRHQNISGGTHASALAEQVSNVLRQIKANNHDALVHIFAACPNSFLFF